MIKHPFYILFDKEISRFLVFIGVFCFQTAFGQLNHYFPVSFGNENKKMFLFTTLWDYPDEITKYADGKFEKIDGAKILKEDTVHLYFTAHCKTNVQGGYVVNYCSVTKKQGKIHLNFSGGAPAYVNRYEVTIKGNKFEFKPSIFYPGPLDEAQLKYKTADCKLVLYQTDYYNCPVLSGYIEANFLEVVTNKNSIKKQIRKYFFKGYFKSPVN